MKSLIYRLFFSGILFFHLVEAYPQNNTIDSLKNILLLQKEVSESKVNTLNELVSKLLDVDSVTAAVPYATEAKEISNKMNYIEGKASAYLNLARLNISRNNLSEGLKFSLSALEMNSALGDTQKVSELHTFSSYIYMRQYNFYQAINSQYKALAGYEKLKDTSQLAYCNLNLAELHRVQGNNEEALHYFSKSLKLYTKLKDKSGIAESYWGTGKVYNAEGKYQQALEMNSAALKIFRELEDTWSIAWCTSAIAGTYEKQGSESYARGDKRQATALFQKAFQNYFYALQLFKDIQSNNDVVKLNSKLGNISIKLGKFNQARPYLEKSMQEALILNDLESIQKSYQGLYKLDSIGNNYKQAFENYGMYILYRDRILNEESKKKTLQLKMQYDFDKKEAFAKGEQEKKDAEQKRIKEKQYYLIGGLFVLVLAILSIAFTQWRNNKRKQKANALLQNQKEKVEITLKELKSTQTQLIQSEKMASLGELTAGIAHEIQNPLNFVNNFSELSNELIDEMNAEIEKGDLEEAKFIAADIKQNLEKINHHGKRADAIVKGMLQHSRSNTGTKEPTDINKLADEYLRLAYHGLRAKDKSFNATLETDFDDSIGKISIIPQDLGRVILNLITNAFYAVNEKNKSPLTPEGGTNSSKIKYDPTVWVSTKRISPLRGDKGGLIISVRDNGNGIPKHVLDKIFQPFFTTKPTGQGTGLGLSMSYDIITKGHGGELKVITKEGEGTTFSIELPI